MHTSDIESRHFQSSRTQVDYQERGGESLATVSQPPSSLVLAVGLGETPAVT